MYVRFKILTSNRYQLMIYVTRLVVFVQDIVTKFIYNNQHMSVGLFEK